MMDLVSACVECGVWRKENAQDLSVISGVRVLTCHSCEFQVPNFHLLNGIFFLLSRLSADRGMISGGSLTLSH